MSITKELAEQLQDKPAVVCCRTTKGTVLASSDLEDPTIFADLEESGLITITPETLKIGQVLGATLKKDVDGLTSLTRDMLDGVKEMAGAAAPVAAKAAQGGNAVETCCSGGMFHLKADQISGLDLSIPLGVFGGAMPQGVCASEVCQCQDTVDEVIDTLEKRVYAVKEVKMGTTTSFENGVLTLGKNITTNALSGQPLIKKLTLDIIKPDQRHVHSDTIMDVVPIACKVEGEVGYGVTHCMSDVVVVLTGVDEDGVQVHEFGSSDGFMDEKIIYGRPGCPDEHDIMIRVHAVLQRKTGMERRGPYAAHSVCDKIVQEIRDVLRKMPATDATKVEKLEELRRHNRPRVLLVKEIMGQGAMHDNVILPAEPAGVPGGRQNVDLGNVPIAMSVNEVRDGGIHALCCIGPASKEMTRHYFREPVLEALASDPELDLVGVVFIGSPQVNDEKTFVSKRLGAMAATMNLDGAIVSTEGFGNNHIDFASNIEELGRRGIQTVGMTYAAYQGQLVVGNKYMDALVELNKDKGGFESERLGENTIIAADARRAVQMLKNKIAGLTIGKSESKWSQEAVDSNQQLANSAKA